MTEPKRPELSEDDLDKVSGGTVPPDPIRSPLRPGMQQPPEPVKPFLVDPGYPITPGMVPPGPSTMPGK